MTFTIRYHWRENSGQADKPGREEHGVLGYEHELADAMSTATHHVGRFESRYGYKVSHRGKRWWLSEGGGEGTSSMQIYITKEGR